MKSIIVSMILPLLIGLLSLPGKSAFALDKVNVTLPSKSFQFIIFPLAKEQGYMKEEGIDLDIVVMASTPSLQAVLAGDPRLQHGLRGRLLSGCQSRQVA